MITVGGDCTTRPADSFAPWRTYGDGGCGDTPCYTDKKSTTRERIPWQIAFS